MLVCKGFALFTLIYIISLSLAEQGSGAALPIQCDSLTVPVQVLKELANFSDKSKGLFSLWKNSMYLTKDKLMKDEVRI